MSFKNLALNSQTQITYFPYNFLSEGGKWDAVQVAEEKQSRIPFAAIKKIWKNSFFGHLSTLLTAPVV